MWYTLKDVHSKQQQQIKIILKRKLRVDRIQGLLAFSQFRIFCIFDKPNIKYTNL